jgi:HPt (histidine-containing phosphotransfer) domain-containing protein
VVDLQTSGGSSACNPEAALVRLGDDRELYREVLERFFAEAPAAMLRIRGAIDKQDAPELHRAAHSFKGLAAMSGTEHVARTAAELEQFGKTNQFEQVNELFNRIQRELEVARHELAPYYQ